MNTGGFGDPGVGLNYAIGVDLVRQFVIEARQGKSSPVATIGDGTHWRTVTAAGYHLTVGTVQRQRLWIAKGESVPIAERESNWDSYRIRILLANSKIDYLAARLRQRFWRSSDRVEIPIEASPHWKTT